MDRLRQQLQQLLPGNAFYARKFAEAGLDSHALTAIDTLTTLPFTTKQELADDQQAHPPYGTNLTFPFERYCRLHQTSGTSTGRPLRWLDTPESWDTLIRCWQLSFPLLGLQPTDKLFFPFSFGPFLGFWTAFEAATRAGYFCLPGGGMTSTARLRFLLDHQCTVIFCTPTYALHLAELAAHEGIDLAQSSVRILVVAGEPGGSIPATRQRIAEVWGARVLDHYGMTELGPIAFESVDTPSTLYVLESEYITEILQPGGTAPTAPGEYGELVVTNLGRLGSPLIRYRTGDLVRAETGPDPRQLGWPRLAGGILGRVDDMIHVRGNNLYPSAIEAIIRRFPHVAEYRLVVDHTVPLTDLRIEVEPAPECDGSQLAEAVSRAVRDEFLFRVAVQSVKCGSLPRFEMKAKRLVHIE